MLICPKPSAWNEAYQKLCDFAEAHKCVPRLPPKPLILGGWAYSNDIQKKNVWVRTIKWAAKNGCLELVSDIPNSEFDIVEEPTSYTVGPTGGPMYRSWDFNKKVRPSSDVLERAMGMLLDQWPKIAGKELSNITHPVAFTGKKARRLLVEANSERQPPWGGWNHLSIIRSERETFTRFRAAVNRAISPHEVDHIEFVTKR